MDTARTRRFTLRHTASLALVVIAAAGLLSACKKAPVTLEGDVALATTPPAAAPAGVAVTLFASDENRPVSQTFTDADGHYLFRADTAPAGTYRLRFGDGSFWNGAASWDDATSVTVDTDTPTHIDATIRPPASTLAGQVTRRSGRPVAGATVSVGADGFSGAVAETTTDVDGNYSIDGLSAMEGTVTVTADAQAGTTVPISLDGSDTTTDPGIVLAPEGRLTGQVTGPPGPWDGVLAVAWDRSTGAAAGAAPINTNGNYTIGELPDGDYTVGVIDTTGRFAPSVLGATTSSPSSGTPWGVTTGATTRVGQHTVSGADCPPGARGADLRDLDLSGANLVACDLAGANLEGVDLSGADLYGANLGVSHLHGASFAGARLDGASLFVADASGVDFSGATLSRTNLRAAAVSGAAFADANLTGVRSGGVVGAPATLPPGWQVTTGFLLGPGADASGADLSGLDLSGRDLHGLVIRSGKLTGANLTGANLTGVDASSTDLAGATIEGADLWGANLFGAHTTGLVGQPARLPDGIVLHDGLVFGPYATVTGADIDGLDLAAANLTWVTSGGLVGTPSALPPGWALVDGYFVGTGATITGADLDGADLSGVSLRNVRSGGLTGTPAALPAGWVLHNGYLVGREAALDHADLSGLSAPGIDLTNTNLMWADLSGANLAGANLTSAHLDVTDLSGADFTGADLTKAAIPRADLSGADFGDATMVGIYSYRLVGAPATLPPGRIVVSGALLCPGAEAAYVDFSGVDLSGLDLSGAVLSMADLSGANLAGTDLSGAILVGADLAGATLTGTVLADANLEDVVATGLTGVPAALPAGWIVQGGTLIPPNG